MPMSAIFTRTSNFTWHHKSIYQESKVYLFWAQTIDISGNTRMQHISEIFTQVTNFQSTFHFFTHKIISTLVREIPL